MGEEGRGRREREGGSWPFKLRKYIVLFVMIVAEERGQKSRIYVYI